MSSKIIYIMLLFINITSLSFSQKTNTPSVYIDCSRCDFNYIKKHIPVVNYVRDRKEADIYVLFTSQKTANGGIDYTLFFKGKNKLSNVLDTVNYVSYAIDTQDLQREKMVKALKLGLIKYLIKSNLSNEINISFTKSKVETKQKDEWNYWLFNFSFNSNFNGQANQDALWLQGSVNANRTTENSKVNFNTYSTYSQNKYVYDNGTEQTNILSLSRAQGLNSYYVNSIDNHWSWGLWAGINTSTYSNLKYSLFAAPGIEYNIFPYTVSNERQFMIDYQIKSIYNNYIQETIFLKNDDYLWSNYVSVSFTLIKPWGNINIHCNGTSFINDLNFYQLGISSNFSVELFKGVSVNFYGGYSKIQDQFSLPISGESLEDVLTQAKQIPTSYNYWGGLGVSYSFGSIYNNFVNSRFDGV